MSKKVHVHIHDGRQVKDAGDPKKPLSQLKQTMNEIMKESLTMSRTDPNYKRNYDLASKALDKISEAVGHLSNIQY